MKKTAFCLMVLAALFSVSCGDGSGSSATPGGETTNPGESATTELEGTWIYSETGYTETYIFSKNTFTASYVSETKGSTVDTGTFVIGGAVTGLSAKKITYTILKTTVDGSDAAVKDATSLDIFSAGSGYIVFGDDKGAFDADGFPAVLETRQYTKQI
jgi:hypothetical protein